MKFAFSRERPSVTSDPNQWFQGGGNRSFPSGEVAEVAGAVIVAYSDEHPAVCALALLPLYNAVAFVKVRGHWQSDVLASGALGVSRVYMPTEQQNHFSRYASARTDCRCADTFFEADFLLQIRGYQMSVGSRVRPTWFGLEGFCRRAARSLAELLCISLDSPVLATT